MICVSYIKKFFLSVSVVTLIHFQACGNEASLIGVTKSDYMSMLGYANYRESENNDSLYFAYSGGYIICELNHGRVYHVNMFIRDTKEGRIWDETKHVFHLVEEKYGWEYVSHKNEANIKVFKNADKKLFLSLSVQDRAEHKEYIIIIADAEKFKSLDDFIENDGIITAPPKKTKN